MQIKIIALLAILGLTQLTACGQKGDLYIPEDPEAVAAALALAEAEEAIANADTGTEAATEEDAQKTTTSE